MGDPALNYDDEPGLSLDWNIRVAKVFDHLAKHLNDEGREAFEADVTDGLLQTMQTGDPRPLNDAVQAWYRTWLFKCNDVDGRDYDLDPADGMTPDEVRKFLGV